MKHPYIKYLKNGWQFTVFVLLMLQACAGGGEEKIPSDVLPEPKMRAVLMDVLLAESYIADAGYNQDSVKQAMQIMYMQIFDKHKVTREMFFTSMNFYTRHPRLLNNDFQPIIDSLSTLEAEAMQAN